MTPKFDITFLYAVLLNLLVIALLVYGAFKLPGLAKRYVNGNSNNHGVIKTNHSVKKSIFLGIAVGVISIMLFFGWLVLMTP